MIRNHQQPDEPATIELDAGDEAIIQDTLDMHANTLRVQLFLDDAKAFKQLHEVDATMLVDTIRSLLLLARQLPTTHAMYSQLVAVLEPVTREAMEYRRNEVTDRYIEENLP